MIIQPAKLRHGSGSGKPEDGLCLMQMVDWFSGSEDVKDTPKCACPVLTALGVRLNDMALTQEDRDTLWPLVWRLLGSRSKKVEQARAEYVVREITHRIVAPIFDSVWPEHGLALRAATSMQEIKEAAWAAEAAAGVAAAEAAAGVAARAAAWAAEAAGAAWAAEVAWAARAAAEVAEAARAAAWAADAAGAARAAAGVAAGAAWAAEAAEVAWAAVWKELRSIFVEAINMGPHGEEDPVFAPRAKQLADLLSV